MAEENKQAKELPTQVRLQVPSIILPSPNQSITVLSPAQQQKLGLDITQLISGQQLNLLASHLSGTPTNESSQHVIIVPEAVDNEAETAQSSTAQCAKESSTGTSHISPASQGCSTSITKPIPSTSSTPAGKGRPNKFVALESGEIVRQNNKPLQKQDEHKSKKPRGRPRKIVAEGDSSKNVDVNESCENSNNNAKGKQSKRPRQSDSESDCAENVSKTDAKNEIPVTSRRLSMQASSQYSQRPRRSVVRSNRYADYEVEDLPQRPENVWITEKPVEVAEAVELNTSGNEGELETPSVVVKSKRGRKKGWKLKKPNEMSESTPIEDNVNCNEEESKDVVSCGACNSKMPRKTYKQHQYKKHNGLAWIEVEESPIDFRDTTIENQNHLSNLIREAFTRKGGNKIKGGFKNSGKFLSCENCDHRCCSAAGYLSHFRFCQVTDEERLLRMWKCPLCKRMMMPSSRYSHENTHKSSKIGKEEKEADEMDNLFNEKEEKKPRRKAAVKAESTIQESLDQYNPELGGPKDPLHLGFRIPKESNRGIGSVKTAWIRQIEADGKALCRNMGCNFSSADLEELQRHHLQECNLKPEQVFECMRCTIHCSSEAEIINHITSAHPNGHTLSDPEFDDGDVSDQLSEYEVSSGEEAATFKKRSQPRATKSISEKTLPEKGGCNLGMGYALRFMMPFWTFRNKVPYRPVLKWMLDFCAKNHSENLLFPNLMKLAKLKPLTQSHLYKPDTQFSVSFCTSKKSHPKLDSNFASKQEWTSIPAFSGNNEAEVPLFFTGGPVISLAWCPTLVSQMEDQILAVSTLSSMNVVPKLKEATSDPGLIQLWNLGKMKNIVTSIKTPHFFMGLGHNWGVVRDIAWCPSGCQSPKYYGLLAAACGDGTVKLIPILKQNDNQLFFHAKCALTLVPHSQQETRSPCLRISWYPGKEHGYIAAGFVDGLVCLWKLKNPSQLLVNVDGVNEKGDELHPYLKFHAHTGPVTALEISSIGDGVPRYIFTGSIAEKNMTYWDLEKLGEVSLGNFNRRSRITGATWMTLWPLATACYEDLQSGTTFIPPRNFCRHFMILPQNSATLSVEKGDWLNGIAQSTVAGEITLMLLNQIIFGMDNEKLQREKRALLTRTCLTSLEISSDSKTEQETRNKNATFLSYEQIGQQGIVFCDVALDSDNVWCRDSKSAQLPESMDSSSSVNYPITAINNVAWNPNASSFSWIAAGYQSGFVRILHVKCKSSDQIISTSIQKLIVVEEKEEYS